MKIPIIERRSAVDPEAYWFFGLFVFIVWILFAGLGGAALFEPDEGRNAEVAREILLLKDPVTPHYDFIPRLDKPVLFSISLLFLSSCSEFLNGPRVCRRF